MGDVVVAWQETISSRSGGAEEFFRGNRHPPPPPPPAASNRSLIVAVHVKETRTTQKPLGHGAATDAAPVFE